MQEAAITTTEQTNASNYVKTGVKLVSLNYPYGYTLKCTKWDWIEFKKGKGFRHVSQTENPKTGRLNAPKAGTYSKVHLLYQDASGYVKSGGTDFYGDEGINSGAKFMNDNFELFTPDEIKYIYETIYMILVCSVKSNVIYRGAKLDELKPLYDTAINAAKEGMKTGANTFELINLDAKAIDNTELPGYEPFVITTYNITANGLEPVQN